jgi:hypothetical protein
MSLRDVLIIIALILFIICAVIWAFDIELNDDPEQPAAAIAAFLGR